MLTFTKQTETPIAAGTMYCRPSIAMGVDGLLRVAADSANLQSVSFFRQTSTNGWQGWEIARSIKGATTGGGVNASRVYVTSIACLDLCDVVAFRVGIKEWGAESIYGPGVVVIPHGSAPGPFVSLPFTTGAVRAARVDGVTFELFSKDGARRSYSPTGTGVMENETANISLGKTGEKLAYWRNGEKWVAAMGGFENESSPGTDPMDDSNVASNAFGRTTWLDADAYPEQGSDTIYPGLGVSAKGMIYLGAVLGGRLLVNKVSPAGAVAFPTGKLPSIGEAASLERHPPQFVAARGRVAAFWTAGRSIMAGDADACRMGKQTPCAVCSGKMAAALAVKGGAVLAVQEGGALRLVKVKIGKVKG